MTEMHLKDAAAYACYVYLLHPFCAIFLVQ